MSYSDWVGLSCKMSGLWRNADGLLCAISPLLVRDEVPEKYPDEDFLYILHPSWAFGVTLYWKYYRDGGCHRRLSLYRGWWNEEGWGFEREDELVKKERWGKFPVSSLKRERIRVLRLKEEDVLFYR